MSEGGEGYSPDPKETVMEEPKNNGGTSAPAAKETKVPKDVLWQQMEAACEEAGVTIEEPPRVEVPEVDLSLWGIEDPDDQTEAQGYLDSLTQFAEESVFFNDQFTDHEERREWKKQLAEQFGSDALEEFYNRRNRLRANGLTACGKALSATASILEDYGYGEDVVKHLNQHDKYVVAELLGRDPETGSQVRPRYQELADNETKKEIANRIIERTTKMLTMLAAGPGGGSETEVSETPAEEPVTVEDA